MKLFLVKNTLRFFAYLPLGINRFFGNLSGSLLYLFDTEAKRVTRINLKLCFPDMPEKEREQITKRSLKETAKYAFEIGSIWVRGVHWCNSKILSVHNEHLFLDALEDERGLLIVAPHFGNWEHAGIYLGQKGKCTVIYSEPKIAELDTLIRKGRSGSKLVPANTKGVVAILKALKKGEMTGVLPDQVPEGEGGIYSNFFGIPTYTQTLIPNLIQKTNSIALQMYAIRKKGGFEIGFMEPDPDIYSEDLQISVDGLNKTIEQLCLMDLSQYQWEYKRFKHQQDKKVNYYRK